jgi:hypothetical protein
MSCFPNRSALDSKTSQRQRLRIVAHRFSAERDVPQFDGVSVGMTAQPALLVCETVLFKSSGLSLPSWTRSE